MRYVATVNVPGYLPMDDDPPVFDTISEAYAYLAEDRANGEEASDDESEEFSETHVELKRRSEMDHPEIGFVHGGTPGSDSPHDLGLVYSVSKLEDVTCGTCGRTYADDTPAGRCPWEVNHPAEDTQTKLAARFTAVELERLLALVQVIFREAGEEGWLDVETDEDNALIERLVFTGDTRI